MIIAIDPGVSGGIAWRKSANAVIDSSKMSWEVLLNLLMEDPTPRVIIEKQQGTGRRSDFVFGVHYGALIAAVELLGNAEPKLVRPQVWQSAFDCPRGMTYNERKIYFKGIAQDRFPEQRPTLATADALLILQWALDKEDRS